jgi:hypothetical protein
MDVFGDPLHDFHWDLLEVHLRWTHPLLLTKATLSGLAQYG